MSSPLLPIVALGAVAALVVLSRKEDKGGSAPEPGPGGGAPAPSVGEPGACVVRTALDGTAVDFAPAFLEIAGLELPGSTTPDGWRRVKLPPGRKQPEGCLVIANGPGSLCVRAEVLSDPAVAQFVAKLQEWGPGTATEGPDGKQYLCFNSDAAAPVASLALIS